MKHLELRIFPAAAVLCLASVVSAQEMEAEAEAEVGADVGVGADAEAEAEAPAEDPMAEEPMAEEPMEPMAEEAAPAEAEAEAAEESNLSFSAFADAYAVYQTSRVGTPVPFHRAYIGNGIGPFVDNSDPMNPVAGIGPVAESGLSLSFVGIDAVYDAEVAAATISFRAGPSVPIYYGGDRGPFGLDNITQGYVTWRPSDKLSLDLGQFGTIFGAEVAESWQNLNYTRGGLYYAMQPFWHTGLRASYAVSDSFGLTGMIVDGVNIVSEAEDAEPKAAPSLALQASIAAGDLSVAAGGLVSTESETDGFDLFFDLVASYDADPLSIVFNADFNQDKDSATGDDATFYGLSLAAGYALTDVWGLAGRVEYLADPDGLIYGAVDGTGALTDTSVITATGTLDIKPMETDTLVIRWDNRFESGSNDIYTDLDGEATDTWFATVLGVVVQGG